MLSRHRAISNDRGVALVTVMLLMMLTTAILTGFLVVVSTDVALRGVDRSRTQAFYAAHAGLEKLTADLGNLFSTDFSPELSDIETIEGEQPDLTHITFDSADGLGYDIAFTANAGGDPMAVPGTVESGPYADFKAILTQYTLTATARTVEGSESRLQRTMQTVSIPVFQFGIFSETDLTFSANGLFSFGGRVHTNGNLYLAASSSGSLGTLNLSERTTVVGEVIRTHLANGRSVSGTHEGTVNLITAPDTYRPLELDEGSLVTTVGSAENEPTWTNLSIGTYNGNVRNGRTGARMLDLPLIALGASPIDLIRRPTAGENALVTAQRMFSQASVRILLSDTTTAITSLPGVSAATPVNLGNNDIALPGYTVDASHPPFAASAGVTSEGDRAPVNTPLLGGFLKVEYRNAAGTWTDVTLEWLNQGIARRNLDTSGCADASTNPDAILRFQRVRASPSTGSSFPGSCAYGTTLETDYWPNVLYDIREAWSRDNLSLTGSTLYAGGVMHYADLDVNNLRRWLASEIGTSGPSVVNEDGFVVYFSDRRGNRTAGGEETGEFGFEDFINPSDGNGTPNSALDDGEDVNGNGTLETYGNTPNSPTGNWTGWSAPFGAAMTLRTGLANNSGNDTAMNKARSNPAVFFRRALKVSNGGLGNLPEDGLTIVAENPVYVEGHYNATASGFDASSAPAAIIGDAVTLLSAAWHDTGSFVAPNNPSANRDAETTYYRFAALAGKGRNWSQLGTPASFGTDGGVHNFMRLIENWNGPTLNYLGSLASFYYSRQALGLFRCCQNVYELPDRSFTFDSNFLDPALLPPKTPMFRDVNTTGFQQVTRSP